MGCIRLLDHHRFHHRHSLRVQLMVERRVGLDTRRHHRRTHMIRRTMERGHHKEPEGEERRDCETVAGVRSLQSRQFCQQWMGMRVNSLPYDG